MYILQKAGSFIRCLPTVIVRNRTRITISYGNRTKPTSHNADVTNTQYVDVRGPFYVDTSACFNSSYCMLFTDNNHQDPTPLAETKHYHY